MAVGSRPRALKNWTQPGVRKAVQDHVAFPQPIANRGLEPLANRPPVVADLNPPLTFSFSAFGGSGLEGRGGDLARPQSSNAKVTLLSRPPRQPRHARGVVKASNFSIGAWHRSDANRWTTWRLWGTRGAASGGPSQGWRFDVAKGGQAPSPVLGSDTHGQLIVPSPFRRRACCARTSGQHCSGRQWEARAVLGAGPQTHRSDSSPQQPNHRAFHHTLIEGEICKYPWKARSVPCPFIPVVRTSRIARS